MGRAISYSICLLLTVLLAGQSKAQTVLSQSVLWPANTSDGIAEHFVYGLVVTQQHTVLAFAEARIAPGDTTPHHIVLKRSNDLGLSWQPSQIIVKSTGGACYANPTPIIDPVSGKVILFYARNYGNQRSEIFFIASNNDGLTWSAPTNLTGLFDGDVLKRPFHLPGPGHGIALRNGRLLLQVWHRNGLTSKTNDRAYGASVIYSDDRGKSWKAGGYIPQNDSLMVNESRLVQLPDGHILIDSRNPAANHHGKRVISISNDLGLSWSVPFAGTMPLSPPVDEGLVKFTNNRKTYLVRSYPAGPGRTDLTVAASANGGLTWPYKKLINKGPSTYSDIAGLPDGSLLVIYGRGNPKAVASAKFNLQWLTQ